MTEREEQICASCLDFIDNLPNKMQNKHLGSVVCMLCEAFDINHEERIAICASVLDVMLEADLRREEGAAQAADAVIARAAAKARK